MSLNSLDPSDEWMGGSGGQCAACGLLQFAVFPKLLVGHSPRKFSRMERLEWLPERGSRPCTHPSLLPAAVLPDGRG